MSNDSLTQKEQFAIRSADNLTFILKVLGVITSEQYISFLHKTFGKKYA